ncbi:MAG: isoleucine--tRNA ligase [Candidatus Omnitrophota bacterium]
MEYKNTLNLPKTDFPMKADLPGREPQMLEHWQREEIHGFVAGKSQGRPKYVLHDGPPYANGNIHIGHALNKILKDFVVKYKTMRGFDVSYVPGWDCHGLPIEHALMKEMKISKHQIEQVEFRKKAHEYAMKFVGIQREQFKRLGVFGDWEHPYLTLSAEYETGILESFLKLHEAGYIYRGLKPVNWCLKCETALAEAEVEYEEHTSPSIYVKFRLEDGNPFGQEAYLVIWTTTPWTLIANVAVAVHPDITYVCARTEKGLLIVARDLLERVMQQCGISGYEILREFKGRELEGLKYSHPFGLRQGKVVLAQYVSREDGTGLVHTAPGHGNDDYLTGAAYKLEVIMPVDNRGNYDQSAGEFAGMNIFKANPLILEKLLSLGALLWSGQIKHSYPHCWRCKTPIIFRATKQWFLNLDHDNLRQKLISAIENEVKWIPPAGKERIKAMVQLRPHWCLSRQRYWGVPVPALVCKTCGEEFFDAGVIEAFIKFTGKEGTDCWFIRGVRDFLPEAGARCPACGTDAVDKGRDILDVWFDSGVSSQAVLKRRKELSFPADLYLEGSDQHRGWFQASLIPAMCIDGRPPFKSVLTHGFVMDGDGRKMSKSLGNVISPEEIIKKYGADILRLWVAASDYNEDIRVSTVILTRLSEAYRKIRNTARFMLSNLYDFSPGSGMVPFSGLREVDKWILSRMRGCLDAVTAAYENFEFHSAYKAVYDFCNEDLSMYYLDMVKGRLYTFASGSVERRAAQTVIFEILGVLVRISAPLLAFTAEEILRNMPSGNGSVHSLEWPDASGEYLKESLHPLEQAVELIPEIAKALEEKRVAGTIGSSFDAKIKLLTNNEKRYKYLTGLGTQLNEIYKVSQTEVVKTDRLGPESTKGGHFQDIAVEVFKGDGVKCVRCWNFSPAVGMNAEHPLLCENCVNAIGGTSVEEKNA